MSGEGEDIEFDPQLARKKTRKPKKAASADKAETEGKYEVERVGNLTVYHPLLPEGYRPPAQPAIAGPTQPASGSAAHRKQLGLEDYGIPDMPRPFLFSVGEAEGMFALAGAAPSGRGDAGDAGEALTVTDGSLDIPYSAMLGLIYRQLGANARDAGGRDAAPVPEPKVVYAGTKRTQITNLDEICRWLHRPAEHLSAFLQAEFKQVGALDAANVLLFKSRIQQQQVRNALTSYRTKYVSCYGCSSINTMLCKDGRQTFVRCSDCGAFRSVGAIQKVQG